MEIDLSLSPEMEKKLNDRAAQSGQTVQEIVLRVLQEHLQEFARTQAMLDSRYDGLKHGEVKLIPGEEVADYFRTKSASARLPLAS